MVRVFANGLGELGSIPGRVISKTQKMVLGATLLNTQHYRWVSRVKWNNPGKCSPFLHFGVVSIEKGAFGSHSTTVANNKNTILKEREGDRDRERDVYIGSSVVTDSIAVSKCHFPANVIIM